MRYSTLLPQLLALCLLPAAPMLAGDAIPNGAKVFIAPMDGFETFMKAAIEAKKVPLVLVQDRTKADFELSGAAQSQKAGAAKKIIMLDWRSSEEASVKLMNLQSGEVVFAYSVNKASSARGKQSSAEACAKHLKQKVGRK